MPGANFVGVTNFVGSKEFVFVGICHFNVYFGLNLKVFNAHVQ